MDSRPQGHRRSGVVARTSGGRTARRRSTVQYLYARSVSMTRFHTGQLIWVPQMGSSCIGRPARTAPECGDSEKGEAEQRLASRANGDRRSIGMHWSRCLG
jgi:hypothetical protein